MFCILFNGDKSFKSVCNWHEGERGLSLHLVAAAAANIQAHNADCPVLTTIHQLHARV